MPHQQIILILASGFGVLLGILLFIFLWTYRKGNKVANKLLSLLILVLSFRVGKSVFMELGNGIDLRLIFIGLSTQLILGPLFYLYTKIVLTPNDKLSLKHTVHFLPFIPALFFSLMITKDLIKELPTSFFIGLFIIYYGHYLVYLALASTKIHAVGKVQKDETAKWLKILATALVLIWFIYVSNLFEDSIPYIIGPVSYSILIFAIAFVAFKNAYLEKIGILKYKTTAIEEGEAKLLYQEVLTLVKNGGYKNSNISLKSLSAQLKTSPHKLSMAVNSNFGNNFNTFVNHYRIEAAKEMLHEPKFEQYTIAAIAYEVGFNSLSSFNEAFRKFNKLTPIAYKKQCKMTINIE